MAKPRRKGTETSETRTRLLDVTERIMLDDGYAAVSSRRVAKAADVTPALVHYYFGTLDDLFLAVLRRRAEKQLERQQRMLESSPEPLRELWNAITDPAGTGLVLEFMGLANHRKAIRSELAAYAEQFRKVQHVALRDRLERTGSDDMTPMAALVLINAVGTNLVLEQSIGMSLGHDETIALVDGRLAELDQAPQG